jgi:hypothetical protein
MLRQSRLRTFNHMRPSQSHDRHGVLGMPVRVLYSDLGGSLTSASHSRTIVSSLVYDPRLENVMNIYLYTETRRRVILYSYSVYQYLRSA